MTRKRTPSDPAVSSPPARPRADRRRRLSPLLAAGLLLFPVAGAVSAVPVRSRRSVIAQGKALYAKERCSLCHSLHGRGGHVGPALDGVGRRWTLNRLAAFLKRPSRFHPHSTMPPVRGTRAQIRAVAAYLMTLHGTPRAGRRYGYRMPGRMRGRARGMRGGMRGGVRGGMMNDGMMNDGMMNGTGGR